MPALKALSSQSNLCAHPPPDDGIELGPQRRRLRPVASCMRLLLPPVDEGPAIAAPPLAAEFPRPDVHLPAGQDCSCGRCAAKVASNAFHTLQAELADHSDSETFRFLAIRSVLVQERGAGAGAGVQTHQTC